MSSPRPKKPTRRHHFTPVLYLRHFADADGALHVVRRSDGRRFRSSPEGIGFERDLYWPDDPQDGDDPEVYERGFGEFEQKAAPVIQQIVEAGAMPTDEDQLGLLFNFIGPYSERPSGHRCAARNGSADHHRHAGELS